MEDFLKIFPPPPKLSEDFRRIFLPPDECRRIFEFFPPPDDFRRILFPPEKFRFFFCPAHFLRIFPPPEDFRRIFRPPEDFRGIFPLPRKNQRIFGRFSLRWRMYIRFFEDFSSSGRHSEYFLPFWEDCTSAGGFFFLWRKFFPHPPQICRPPEDLRSIQDVNDIE